MPSASSPAQISFCHVPSFQRSTARITSRPSLPAQLLSQVIRVKIWSSAPTSTPVSYQGFRFCPIDKRHERRVPGKTSFSMAPNRRLLHVHDRKNRIFAVAVQAVQHDGLVVLVKIRVLVPHERREHLLAAAAQVMPIDGDVPPRRSAIRIRQRKQRSNYARLSAERMVQVIIGIIRLHDGIIHVRLRNPQPCDKIRILRQTCGQVHRNLCRLFADCVFGLLNG